MQSINIGLLGLGTVGQGVYTLINEHQQELNHQTGFLINITKILVRDLDKKRQVPSHLLTDDQEAFLFDPTLDIIIEVAGGIDSAYESVSTALSNHKHVITANKDLMALHGAALLTQAKKNHCDLFYEASVCGGIPIIRSIVDGLSSDKITEVVGIVNGTTNYIFTKMDHDGMSYQDALAKAQSLGFAESDPTNDVGGFDAGRKMAILSNLAFSMPIDTTDVRIRGISGVTLEDLTYAKQLDYEMKLLGIAKIKDGAVEVSVEPTLIPHTHPLTSVHDEYNAVLVKGEAVGTTMFYGPGAGGLPTATAIVSDLISVVKNIALGTTGRNILAPRFTKQLKTPEEIYGKYFLRIKVKDEVGVFAEITALFSKYLVSFEKIIQNALPDFNSAEIMIVTHKINLKALNNTLEALSLLSVVEEVLSYYKIEEA